MRKVFFILILCFLMNQGFSSGLLSVGGGVIDPSEPKGLYQIEYKWGYLIKGLRLQMGALTEEFRSFYGYIGLGLDIFLTNWFVVTPSFAPGLYLHGSARDLGYPLEFRSCFECAIEFNNCWRIGGQFYHLSNASLGHKNPGVNAAALFLGIPF